MKFDRYFLLLRRILINIFLIFPYRYKKMKLTSIQFLLEFFDAPEWDYLEICVRRISKTALQTLLFLL